MDGLRIASLQLTAPDAAGGLVVTPGHGRGRRGALGRSTLIWSFVAAVVLIALNALLCRLRVRDPDGETLPPSSRRSWPTAEPRGWPSLDVRPVDAAGGSPARDHHGLPWRWAYVASRRSRRSSSASVRALSPEIDHGGGHRRLAVGRRVPPPGARRDGAEEHRLGRPDATLRWLVLPYRLLGLVPTVDLWSQRHGERRYSPDRGRARDERESVHSASELAAIVSRSLSEGAIEADDAELLTGALDFAQRPVGEVAHRMSGLRSCAWSHGCSGRASGGRVRPGTHPHLASSDPEQRLIGYVHARDLLALDADSRRSPLPPDLVRSMAIVRATDP